MGNCNCSDSHATMDERALEYSSEVSKQSIRCMSRNNRLSVINEEEPEAESKACADYVSNVDHPPAIESEEAPTMPFEVESDLCEQLGPQITDSTKPPPKVTLLIDCEDTANPFFDPHSVVSSFLEAHPLFEKEFRFNGLWKQADPGKIMVIFHKKVAPKSN